MSPGRTALLERELELARLAAAIDGACAAEGSIVLIEGPAGIGKTALLRAAGELANGKMTVLSARATELEREFPFGAIRQLLEPPLRSATEDRRVELLEGAAAHAAPALELADPAATAAVDTGFATLNGLYWLIAGLAEREPLLLTLDDAHWADPESLRFLTFLAPRLTELPVLLLLAARTGEWPPGSGLAATASDPAAGAVVPAPLSEQASAALVRARFEEDAHPEFARACHAATGGNPFYLHALIDELARDHVAPSPKAAERVLGLGPHAVGQVIVARLARLAPAAAPLARAVAVLGDDTALEHAAQLAELQPDEARAALAELADAAILEHAEPLRFSHPIIRNAVYGDIGHPERADHHRKAAELLAAPGGAPERIPGHLLAVAPTRDPLVVKALREAAENALARGAVDSAVAYLRRALDEPPPESDRAEVLLELGQAEARVVDPQAVAHVEVAASATADPNVRVGALGTLAFIRFIQSDSAGAFAAAREGLEQIRAGAGGEAEAWMLASSLWAGRAVPELVDEVAALLERPRTGPDGTPTPAELIRVAFQAHDALLRGRRQSAAQLLHWVAKQPGELSDTELAPIALTLGFVRAFLGRDREAEATFQRVLENARRRANKLFMGESLDGLAYLRWRRGDLKGAIADADTMLGLFTQLSDGKLDHPTTWVRIMRALCLLERGDLAAAGSALKLPHELEARLPGTWWWLWLPYGRGKLALARGDWAEALEQALAAGQRVLAIQAPSPDYMPWRSLAAQAMGRGGEPDQALALAREELELARREGSARAAAVSLMTVGSIAGGEERLAVLREAVELLDGSSDRLEHARALVDLGAALRRAGRRAQAREPLDAGMALARSCGAVPLAERAYAELRAAGARPRKPAYVGVEALTPSELRVAGMAAEGMSNREIAQSLFVTVKTVEFHLGQTYRKLEISSREGLGGALRERGGFADHPSP